jgi:hypothetical protein
MRYALQMRLPHQVHAIGVVQGAQEIAENDRLRREQGRLGHGAKRLVEQTVGPCAITRELVKMLALRHVVSFSRIGGPARLPKTYKCAPRFIALHFN